MGNKKITRIEVNSAKIRDYIYKNGETYQSVSNAIGLDNTSFGRYLKQNELPKPVYMSVLMHFGIKDVNFFKSEEVKKEEQKNEESRNVLKMLNIINEKLEKLEFINQNLCELVDVTKESIQATSETNELLKEFIKQMTS